MFERINSETDKSLIDGHLTRYCLAGGLTLPGDVVLDAACGSGYGARILCAHGDVSYVGVDIDQADVVLTGPQQTFVQADLQTWSPKFSFDVFVGFETIEHLPSFDHWVRIAKLATRWIVVSAPVVPTKHVNPYHVHDFVPGDLVRIFADAEWQHVQTLSQPGEVSEISIFRRR